jgi:hypothetical protein
MCVGFDTDNLYPWRARRGCIKGSISRCRLRLTRVWCPWRSRRGCIKVFPGVRRVDGVLGVHGNNRRGCIKGRTTSLASLPRRWSSWRIIAMAASKIEVVAKADVEQPYPWG